MPAPRYLDVPINDHRFRLNRAPADVGSWLLMQMMDTLMRSAERYAREAKPASPSDTVSVSEGEAVESSAEMPKAPEVPSEAMTALAVNEMLRELPRARFREIQMLALANVQRLVDLGERVSAFSVVVDDRIVDEAIAFDAALALNVTTKALVFILSPSYADGSPQQK